MLIVWKDEHRDHEAGRIADYCIECKAVESMLVVQNQQRTLLYFVISLGWRTRYATCYCRACGTAVPYHKKFYTGLQPLETEFGLDALIEKTNPSIKQRAARIDRANKGRSTTTDRQELIADAIGDAGRLYTPAGRTPPLVVFIACEILIGLFGCLVVKAWFGSGGPGSSPNATAIPTLFDYALASALAMGIAFTICWFDQRKSRKRALSTGIELLTALRATPEEVERAIPTVPRARRAWLKWWIGRDLVRALE